jgi:hypothetical protein
MAAPSYTHPFVPPTFLNVTALWAENGASVLQCWQILPGFATSSQSGTVGASILQLGAVSNMSYSVLPPGFNAGLHNAPTEQCVFFFFFFLISTPPPCFVRFPLIQQRSRKKVGRVPIGPRARHAPRFVRRRFDPWRGEWPHLCGGHGGKEHAGSLHELPVQPRDPRAADPHERRRSQSQCALLRPM